MSAALRGAELQVVVDGTEVLEATAPEWLKRESKAFSKICSTVNRKSLEHLINCKMFK